MFIDPETARVTGEIVRIVTSDVGRGFLQTVCDATGLRPRAILNRAKAEAEKRLLLSKTNSQVLIDQAEAEGKISIMKMKNDIEVKKIKTKRRKSAGGLARRSSARQKHLDLIEQRNLEQIAGKALLQLPCETSGENPDPDWIYRCFDNCKWVGNDQMQIIWSKILADEISHPGSFSVLTLETMKSMSRVEADLFTKLCSQAWTWQGRTFPIFSLSYQTFSGAKLDGRTFNLISNDMQHLKSFGLVNEWDVQLWTASYRSHGSSDPITGLLRPIAVTSELEYFGQEYAIDVNLSECEKTRELVGTWDIGVKFESVLLSTVGKELMPISGAIHDETMIAHMKDLLGACKWVNFYKKEA